MGCGWDIVRHLSVLFEACGDREADWGFRVDFGGADGLKPELPFNLDPGKGDRFSWKMMKVLFREP
jgi:hypothetical protein